MLPKNERKNNGKLINLLLQNWKDFLISYSLSVRAHLKIPTPMRFVLFLVLQNDTPHEIKQDEYRRLSYDLISDSYFFLFFATFLM